MIDLQEIYDIARYAIHNQPLACVALGCFVAQVGIIGTYALISSMKIRKEKIEIKRLERILSESIRADKILSEQNPYLN